MTSNMRAKLRGLANHLDPILHVGAEGITPGVVTQCDDALTARELIKGTVLKNSDFTARMAADALSEETGADVIQVIGRRFVLFRKNPENPVVRL